MGAFHGSFLIEIGFLWETMTTMSASTMGFIRVLESGPMLWEQEVGGSNPPVPTSYIRRLAHLKNLHLGHSCDYSRDPLNFWCEAERDN